MFERYRQLRVLVTGHTGFKGAWLCAWLKKAGAEVAGLALPPEQGRPNLFAAAGIEADLVSTMGDIRDFGAVRSALESFRPAVVFHLAAQALVRRSYRDPVRTFGSNVMGTVHVLEAARETPSVKAIVCVTTDKVYENREWVWGYRECDRLGGKDPYSASKACAELVANAYQSTLLPLSGKIALATARGGNVVGGGDWSEDRIVPDMVRWLLAEECIVLRHPAAVRPWQHVLELCRGYLNLGLLLLDEPAKGVGAWNFGPASDNEVNVHTLARDFCRVWGAPDSQVRVEASHLEESGLLRLENAKAAQQLGWRPALSYSDTVRWTADWYRRFHLDGELARRIVDEQLDAYVALMRK